MAASAATSFADAIARVADGVVLLPGADEEAAQVLAALSGAQAAPTIRSKGMVPVP